MTYQNLEKQHVLNDKVSSHQLTMEWERRLLTASCMLNILYVCKSRLYCVVSCSKLWYCDSLKDHNDLKFYSILFGVTLDSDVYPNQWRHIHPPTTLWVLVFNTTHICRRPIQCGIVYAHLVELGLLWSHPHMQNSTSIDKPRGKEKHRDNRVKVLILTENWLNCEHPHPTYSSLESCTLIPTVVIPRLPQWNRGNEDSVFTFTVLAAVMGTAFQNYALNTAVIPR